MTIGIIADAQYADADNSPTRHYRASIAKLRAAGDEINARRPRFTIHLGDIVDRYEESFATILPVYDRIRGPRFHVLGNHDYPMAAERVYDVLGMETPYYHFRRNGWRFVVLDTNDLSLYANPAGSPKYQLARAMLDELRSRGAINAQTWNGGLSEEQLAWLDAVLAGARRRGEPALVMGHMPLYPANVHNVWNDAAVIEVLERSGNVAAYFNGHNHSGNYGLLNGIHYVNFHGMVELETNAFSIVRIGPGRLEID